MSSRARSIAAPAAAVAWILLSPLPAGAAEIRLRFTAVQRLLTEAVFTQDGRRYVKGDRNARCSYGYLAQPQVDASPDGRLRIRARFSGRSALNLFDHCIGFGDEFSLVMTATPYVENGVIRLKAVQVDPATRSLYGSRVCRALADSLPAQFAYPAAEDVRRALESPSPGYRRVVRRLELTRLAVTAEALVVTVDFELDLIGT